MERILQVVVQKVRSRPNLRQTHIGVELQPQLLREVAESGGLPSLRLRTVYQELRARELLVLVFILAKSYAP